MRFQIGDLAVIKNTEKECKIIGEVEDEMYLVKIEGRDYLVFYENLETAIFDWKDDFKLKKKNLKYNSKEQKPLDKNVTKQTHAFGISLGFYPNFKKSSEKEIDSFTVYLFNNDKLPIEFHYKCMIQNKVEVFINDKLLPYTNQALQTLKMEDMHLLPHFIFSQDIINRIENNISIKLKSKKLFEYLQILSEGRASHFHITLEESDSYESFETITPINIGESISKNISTNPYSVPKSVRELDLHIEKIKKDFQHLTNAEIIQIQISAFEQALQAAIQTGQSDITFIHGVGKGVLKEQIHQILREEFYVRHFICEWSPKYGYGATQVFFNV